MISLDHFGLTDPGKVRQNNEDALLSGGDRDPGLFVVADGIGGFEAGEVASSMVIESLQTLGPGEPLEPAIQEANRRVYSAARSDEKLSGMGTTVVAARITENGDGAEAEIAHVGDSRLYLVRDGELSPLTEDHSLVAEMVRSGSLTRAQASDHPQKNLITRALGAEEEVEVDTARHSLRHGDRLVLCSDGLPDMVTEDRISELATDEAPGSAEESVRNLISAALDAGGSDNVTVLVVDVQRETERESGPQPPPSEPPPSEKTSRIESPSAAAATSLPSPSSTDVGQPDTDSPERGTDYEDTGSDAGEAARVRRLSDKGEKGEGGDGSDRGERRSGSSGRSGRQRRRGKSKKRIKGDGSYTRLRKGESLIPGVWDRTVVEEPEPAETREPTPEEIVERYRVPAPDPRETNEDPRRRKRRKRAAQRRRAVSAIIRGLAALALLGLLLVPPYLWWSTRYYMAYDGDEIVVHQGVPYDFLGNELNRVDRRTGVQRSDIAEPYRDQIRDNKLYTEERLQTVLGDLQEG
jgi:protein phosphatase